MDLRQLERALAAFAGLNPTHFYLHHAQVFLVIASLGQPSYADIEEATGLTNSSVSRTVHALGEIHRRGHPGFGLVETFQDPEEARRFRVRLSAKGKALLRQLQGL